MVALIGLACLGLVLAGEPGMLPKVAALGLIAAFFSPWPWLALAGLFLAPDPKRKPKS